MLSFVFLSESICALHYLNPIPNKFLVTNFWFVNDTSLHQNTMTENGSSNMYVELLLQKVKKQPLVTLVDSGEQLGMGLECSGFRFSTHLGHILKGPEFQRNSNSSEKKKQKQLWCWSKEFTEWCPVPRVVAVPTPSQDVITGCNLLHSNFICSQVLCRLQCIANLMEKRYSTTGPFWTLHKHKDLTISDVRLI